MPHFASNFSDIATMKDELTEIATDLAEIGLDSQLADGLLKDLPIVGLVYKVGKVALSIPDLILAAKVKKFLVELDKIEPEKREQFRRRVENDPDLAQRTGQAVLLSIDSADELEKAAIIGVLFTAYVNEELTLTDFRRMLYSMNRAFIDDLRNLIRNMATSQKSESFDFPELSGTPLVQTEFPQFGSIRSDQALKPRETPTQLGLRFAELLRNWAAA